MEPEAGSPPPITIYTIGHSTRPIDEFLAIVSAHDIRLVVDVRTIPRSRHNPQFNSDSLERSLKPAGIGYLHRKGLGGLRHAKKDSVNTGWETAGFRGYADYMQSEEFTRDLGELIETAKRARTAVMCAEAVPWKCHRTLISDALTVRGIRVMHIMSKTSLREHVLTPWADAKGVIITYPKK